MLCFNCFFFFFSFFLQFDEEHDWNWNRTRFDTISFFFPSENFFFLNIQLSALALETWEAEIAQSMLPY